MPEFEIGAAGGLLISHAVDGTPMVAVVHRPGYEDWTFPKGKLDPGETFLDAAMREVREETGLIARPDVEVGETRYVDGHGRSKLVRWWLMYVGDGEFVPNEECDELRWCAPSEVASLLTYERDRELFGGASSWITPLVCIRHADAGDRNLWTSDQSSRPLSTVGLSEAESLVSRLRGRPITRCISSPAIRCIQTLTPLSIARRVPIEIDPRLDEGTPWDVHAGVWDELRGEPAALCTHGDVMPELSRHFPVDGELMYHTASSILLEGPEPRLRQLPE